MKDNQSWFILCVEWKYSWARILMKSKIYDTFAESSRKIQLELLQSSDLLQHFPLFSKVFANKNLFALRIVQREFSEKTWYRGGMGEKLLIHANGALKQ